MFINTTAFVLAVFTGAFRLAEIGYGEKNAAAMLAKGGKEFAPQQRLPIFILYTLWLCILPIITPKYLKPNLVLLAVFFALEGLRWWAIAHLRGFWTTRVIILAHAKRIVTGPYRFFAHPIYIALFGEVLALSLAFGQWHLGCFVGGLTALWIYLRTRTEDNALKQMGP